MNSNIQTSTPIIFDKLIPPPSRKLWSADSPTEQLYRNKWTKYRNSIEEKESWSDLEAPKIVNFDNISDARDSYFDNVDSDKFATPERTLAKKLPGVDSENNNINIVEFMSNCTLSSIKKRDDEKQNNNNELLLKSCVLVYHLTNDSSSFLGKPSDAPLKINDNDEIDMDAPKPPDDCVQQNSAKGERLNSEKDIKKNSSNGNASCTVVEPFSFEYREKYKKEHRRARRERDSIGKETWNGFRANPVPKFLKLREKNRLPVTTRADDKKKKIGCVALERLNNAAETSKKKTVETSQRKKATIVPKSPQLRTAIRARERQRFEEHMREKELQRLAAQKQEEAERKKREAEEIAKLRKQLVHKAQPIRKFKMIIPRTEKRPLSEPMVPITHKRRRKI